MKAHLGANNKEVWNLVNGKQIHIPLMFNPKMTASK